MSAQGPGSQVWRPEHLRLAIDAARVALWSWHVDSNRFTMDERAFELWGLAWAAEVSFEELSAHIHPADRDRVRTAFLATRSVAGSYEIDFRIIVGDDIRWVSARGQGADAGIVDLSTFNVANTVLASGADTRGDWLLVNVAPGWESIAIMRERQLIFFRNRGADGEGTLADLVHQTAMYYEDRLDGSGFGRVLVCGATDARDSDALRRGLADRLATTVETVNPTGAAGLIDRRGVSPGLLDAMTPLVGLVLRTREAA